MKKTTAFAFPLHIGDWLKGTAMLRPAERGYYLDLLLYQWDNETPLPDDEEQLMQIARCIDRKAWRQAWTRLQAKFVRVSGGGWINERCEIERDRLKDIRDKRAKAGSNGAAKRWQEAGDRDGNAASKQAGKPIANANSEIANGIANGWPPDPTPDPVRAETTDQSQRATPARAPEAPHVEVLDLEGDEPVSRTPPAFRRRARHQTALEQADGLHTRTCAPWAIEACRRGVCVPTYLWQRWERRQPDRALLRAFVDAWVDRACLAGDDERNFWPKAFEAHFGTAAPAPPPARQTATQRTLANYRSGQ